MVEAKEKNAHVWERDQHDHYVEPDWCVDLLLDNEEIVGGVWDPACGFGTIPKACGRRGITCIATDLIDRGYSSRRLDFLTAGAMPIDNIITNPPYKLTREFIDRALSLTRRKVAVIVPLKFLASNTRFPLFTSEWPVSRIWVMSSRPSMLPGAALLAGQQAKGGAVDFCWIVFDHAHEGEPLIGWLKKQGGVAKPYTRTARVCSPESALRRAGE